MTFEEVRQIVDAAVYAQVERHLSDVELTILKGSWDDLTYDEMAKNSPYGANYLKGDAGHNFWKLLSDALGEQVSKRNFRAALARAESRFTLTNHDKADIILEDTSQPAIPSQDKPSSESKSQVQIALASKFYIERPPIEEICHEAILQPGALIRIKAPSKMGKTLLMENILRHAGNNGCQTVRLNLLQVDEKVISDLDKFLHWFCTVVTRRVQLENKVDEQLENKVADFWDKDAGSNDKCTAYFEEDLLPNINSSLVLGLDNVDRVFQHKEVAKDFFCLLRSWYEDAILVDSWKKLRLVVAHSTEVSIRLDINRSPFNVGLSIDPQEFNPEQVKALAKLYKLDWDESHVQTLMKIVGGHPYLVNEIIYYIKVHPDNNLEDLLKAASTETGLYDNYLRQHLWNLKEKPELATAMKKVVNSKEPVLLEANQAFELYSMGLVNWHNNNVEVSCELYRSYFKNRL